MSKRSLGPVQSLQDEHPMPVSLQKFQKEKIKGYIRENYGNVEDKVLFNLIKNYISANGLAGVGVGMSTDPRWNRPSIQVTIISEDDMETTYHFRTNYSSVLEEVEA